MPFSGDILLYGSEQKEVLIAAEILFDNGFETFYFLDSYESLFLDLDVSFIRNYSRCPETNSGTP